MSVWFVIPAQRGADPCCAKGRLLARSCLASLLAGLIGLAGTMPAAAEQLCRPVLAVKDVQFSPMQPPTPHRIWSATVSVDASHCGPNTSGSFDIGFSRLKETGAEMEFREQFIWLTPSVKVAVEFWVDEAAERYWIDN